MGPWLARYVHANLIRAEQRRYYLESRGPYAKDKPFGKVMPGERGGVPGRDADDDRQGEERQPAEHSQAERLHDWGSSPTGYSKLSILSVSCC
jgi:hypothetical protein